MKTEMKIEEIKEGPPIDYRKTINSRALQMLESELDDMVYLLVPKRRYRELLRRWMIYYYMTEDKITGPLDSDQPSDIITYNEPTASKAALKTLALHKKLNLRLFKIVSFYIFLAAIAVDAVLLFTKNPDFFPAYLLALLIGVSSVFVSIRCNTISKDKKGVFGATVFVIYYAPIAVLWGSGVFFSLS